MNDQEVFFDMHPNNIVFLLHGLGRIIESYKILSHFESMCSDRKKNVRRVYRDYSQLEETKEKKFSK